MIHLKPSNQSMKPTPHLETNSARLPRHPAMAYLFLVRLCALQYVGQQAGPEIVKRCGLINDEEAPTEVL